MNAEHSGGNGSHAPFSSDNHKQRPPSWEALFCVVMFFASLVAAIMLWKAIGGKHPYAFYTALRWVCFSLFFCSAIATFRVTRKYDEIWLLPVIFGALLGALAVLFNPFLEFHFRRETWRVIDIVSFVCVLLLILAFYGGFGEQVPAHLRRGAKLVIWFIAAGVVGYYAVDEGVRLYGKYALATAGATATVFNVEEDYVEDTGQSGVKYTGVYKFQVNGKTYYGRTDEYDEVGDRLAVRYNPAHPSQNRDASNGFNDLLYDSFIFVGFLAAIIYGFYRWLRWIPESEKAKAVRRKSSERTEIV